ncbi:hypothetical protein E2C01_053925 [Portunus trituberculatus]|uniref:Uncharacterized protein n=1 Tax=Portunus trituberculatus TaxID=210409 RepID=A0A5B7GQM6_PORTR|nr:hypothetical protein [Portunus trituberculatus]
MIYLFIHPLIVFTISIFFALSSLPPTVTLHNKGLEGGREEVRAAWAGVCPSGAARRGVRGWGVACHAAHFTPRPHHQSAAPFPPRHPRHALPITPRVLPVTRHAPPVTSHSHRPAHLASLPVSPHHSPVAAAQNAASASTPREKAGHDAPPLHPHPLFHLAR